MSTLQPGSRALERGALIAGIAGVVGVAAALAARHSDAAAMAASWLTCWWLFTGVALGSLANVMIHELTGGAWGFVIRRPLEAAIGTLPALALLALPLAFDLGALYPWARAGAGSVPHLAARLWYMNPVAFGARAAVCFAIWIAIAALLRREDTPRQRDGAPQSRRRARTIAIAGLLLYAPTMTLASVDWIMSLSPDWYSTAFGLLVMVDQSLGAFVFALACAVFAGGLPAGRHESASVTGDLGNLLLMFAMLWAYLAFSQFLVIWAEDLPAEISWYVARSAPRWRGLAIGVFALQFALPFGAMLFRPFKREPRRLAWLCAVVFAAHCAEMLWIVGPPLRAGRFIVQWTDPIAALAIGGIWTAVFCWNLARVHERPFHRTEGVASHG